MPAKIKNIYLLAIYTRMEELKARSRELRGEAGKVRVMRVRGLYAGVRKEL